MTVMAGITPVSMGGDSIGGTIAVESRPPVFASGSEQLHEEGTFIGLLSQQRPELWRLADRVGGRPQPGLGLHRIVDHQRRLHRRQRPQGYFNLCAEHRPRRHPRGRGIRKPPHYRGRLASYALPGLSQRADGHGAQLCRVAQSALPQKLRGGWTRRACVLAGHVALDEHRPGQIHLPHAHVDADEHAWKGPGLFRQV